MKRGSGTGRRSRPLERYLCLTAASTGAVILVVEILGAKMLSPWFGTSHFVWTAQIAVALLALSGGYWLGGSLARGRPDPILLYRCLLGAGAWLCLAVPMLRPVAELFLPLPLAIGSVLASLFLFLVPLTLMAVTGPFVIRALTRSAEEAGRQSGRLFAISTLGSVLGVVLIGYVLIPLLPNSITLLGTASVLLLLSLAYALAWGRSHALRFALAALGALALGIGGWLWQRGAGTGSLVEVHRRNSPFGLLQVMDSARGDVRYLLNDWLAQNIHDPSTGQSRAQFTYLLHDLAVAYGGPPGSVLVVGLGTGVVPGQFAREGARVDVVEINPEVEEIAREHFGFDAGGVEIHLGDGRRFLQAASGKWDAILLDAFVGDSVPVHLMTRECFLAARERLAPGGVLVINCFGYFEPSRDFFPQSLARTLLSVFPSLRIHDSGTGNLFFVASPRESLPLPSFPSFGHVHPAIRNRVAFACRNRIEPDPRRGSALTDDYNPVEFHDAMVREDLRRGMARSMRER